MSLIMRKRVLAIWLVVLVLGFSVGSVSANGTVILHPGYIMGTVPVTVSPVTDTVPII